MEREFPKLALDDEVLMMVDKPARYIGCEVNSVRKDLKDIDVRFCMCFPDVYEVGMSHLGISILYIIGFSRLKFNNRVTGGLKYTHAEGKGNTR